MLDEGEWKTKKHGVKYLSQRCKVYLGIVASASEIRAIKVTDNTTSDAPMLPCLFDQIAYDEIIASVSGNRAYNTGSCHRAIAQREAQMIFPTCKSANP